MKATDIEPGMKVILDVPKYILDNPQYYATEVTEWDTRTLTVKYVEIPEEYDRAPTGYGPNGERISFEASVYFEELIGGLWAPPEWLIPLENSTSKKKCDCDLRTLLIRGCKIHK